MSPTATEGGARTGSAVVGRYRTLPGFARSWLRIAALGSTFCSIYIIFGLGNVLGLYVPLETEYFYALVALLLPLAFLIYPAVASKRDRVPWYDTALAVASFAVPAYFAYSGNAILEDGWEYDAPRHGIYLAFVLWGLVLEATRRAGGNAIFVICLVVSVYPIFSHFAPGFLEGDPVAPVITAGFHIFGTESILGIPMGAFANLVIGFLVFGVALQFTGGGEFFLNLAFSLLGRRRGGPAKVAI
ncbi:MAG: TRAP transporter large permease subunit, partial [Gammaproteobacteria bacterium]